MDRDEKAENSLQTIAKSNGDTLENDMNEPAFEGGNAEIIEFAETPGETTDAFPDATVAADEYREPVLSTAMKESDTDIAE